jgi:hypothetical protein
MLPTTIVSVAIDGSMLDDWRAPEPDQEEFRRFCIRFWLRCTRPSFLLIRKLDWLGESKAHMKPFVFYVHFFGALLTCVILNPLTLVCMLQVWFIMTVAEEVWYGKERKRLNFQRDLARLARTLHEL